MPILVDPIGAGLDSERAFPHLQLTAAIVVALNVAFFIDRGEVPVAAFVLVTVSLVLLVVAVGRLRAEEHEAGTTSRAVAA